MAYPQKKRTPSFSSSVLDSIYRSIDESDGIHSDIKRSINGYNENVSSSSSSSSPPNRNDDKLTTLPRAIMNDEHWLYSRTSTTTTTTTNSADSSSEAESYRAKRRSRKLADQGNRSSAESQKTKRTFVLDNAGLVSKSYSDKNLKAVKLLEESKRPKQPVSPGARLTSFLNSIFQSKAKKVKLCSVGKTTDIKSTSSRSCFSRTRYTTDNNNCNNLKRSVRFYRVRVTVDGDCRDSIYNYITRKKKPIPEFTGKKGVGTKANIHHTELPCITRKNCLKNSVTSCRDEDEDEEEEDDVWSYSSSDLFELDNHRIGKGRYIKELPVYETTHFNTNQAIARGLLL